MDLQGEYLMAAERVVVSPAAGVFVPAADVPEAAPGEHADVMPVEPGTTLGFVRTGADDVPVVSPFGGVLVSIVATAGERLTEHQRVAWLRAS
jgi:[acyl-carrier-protein] S-malonyltransferase